MMTITNQIFGIIYRNPSVTLNDIIENCTNQEYAETLLNGLVDEGRVVRVSNSGDVTDHTNGKYEE